MKRYLEEIIIRKSETNLDQLAEALKENVKSCSSKLKVPKYPSSEIIHFIKDLSSMEDRYGELSYISRLNRRKFNKLQETELKIMDEYRNSLQKEDKND